MSADKPVTLDHGWYWLPRSFPIQIGDWVYAYNTDRGRYDVTVVDQSSYYLGREAGVLWVCREFDEVELQGLDGERLYDIVTLNPGITSRVFNGHLWAAYNPGVEIPPDWFSLGVSNNDGPIFEDDCAFSGRSHPIYNLKGRIPEGWVGSSIADFLGENSFMTLMRKVHTMNELTEMSSEKLRRLYYANQPLWGFFPSRHPVHLVHCRIDEVMRSRQIMESWNAGNHNAGNHRMTWDPGGQLMSMDSIQSPLPRNWFWLPNDRVRLIDEDWLYEGIDRPVRPLCPVPTQYVGTYAQDFSRIMPNRLIARKIHTEAELRAMDRDRLRLLLASSQDLVAIEGDGHIVRTISARVNRVLGGAEWARDAERYTQQPQPSVPETLSFQRGGTSYERIYNPFRMSYQDMRDIERRQESGDMPGFLRNIPHHASSGDGRPVELPGNWYWLDSDVVIEDYDWVWSDTYQQFYEYRNRGSASAYVGDRWVTHKMHRPRNEFERNWESYWRSKMPEYAQMDFSTMNQIIVRGPNYDASGDQEPSASQEPTTPQEPEVKPSAHRRIRV